MFDRICLFVLAAVLFTACSPATTSVPPVDIENNSSVPSPLLQADNPYAPQAGDGVMMCGDLKINSASLSVAKSQPLQVTLNFAYFQPTPCYQLRVEVSQPDVQNRINAYAVVEKDKPCALMALAVPIPISLDLGSFPKGHCSVWLNDVKVDEFDS